MVHPDRLYMACFPRVAEGMPGSGGAKGARVSNDSYWPGL